MKKTICICASISFYKNVIEAKNQLKTMGFNVVIPHLAEIMEKEQNYDLVHHMARFYGIEPITVKSQAIMKHFKKISQSDILLVINNEKHGIKGYIGGNVLMEMGIAFYLNKPIYILNPVDNNKSYLEEINAMKPIIIQGDISKIIA